jgi:hypothetical protein
MRSWSILLGGLLIWALHFFVLYGIGEFGGDGTMPRLAVGAFTLACLAAGLFLAFHFRNRAPGDDFARWRTKIAFGGLLLASIAIVWQGLPALFPG